MFNLSIKWIKKWQIEQWKWKIILKWKFNFRINWNNKIKRNFCRRIKWKNEIIVKIILRENFRFELIRN